MIFDLVITLSIIGVALFGICTSDNIIKSIVCFNIVQATTVLLFILLASNSGSEIPIVSNVIGEMVDPLPQALMITAIVISASVTALSLMMSVVIFHAYGTLNWQDLSQKEGRR